ncbi:MAG: hypothetical protein AAFX76_09020 [Planctomycetota bacterium]
MADLLLPGQFEALIRPVFEALPLERAMGRLVVDTPPTDAEVVDAAARVAEAVASPALAGRLDLVSGLWLYVDDLDRAHAACQALETPTGSYWHGVVHRREGDFSNACYWFGRAGEHPAMDAVDADGFVQRVAAAYGRGDHSDIDHVAAQRAEWAALFGWCVGR